MFCYVAWGFVVYQDTWILLNLLLGGHSGCCKLIISVPGPVQTVQRCEISGVILALQADIAVHVGGDRLGAVRNVNMLLVVSH